jgi:hypothetical protein
MLLSIIITSCQRESSKMVETPVELPALATMEISTPATAIVDSRQMETAFLCPSPRDEDEPGGRFSLYTAPLSGEDETLPVTCSIES